VAFADREIARRIARVELEFPRREADVRLDKIGIKANAARGRIDVGAGPFQHCAGLVVQEVDADLLEHAERRLMDRFEPPPRSAARRRRRPVSCGDESVAIAFLRFLSASRPARGGADGDSSLDPF
jgi:hypothetical protein